MSEVMTSCVWIPPAFPIEGRLPLTELQVNKNHWLHGKEERDYHNARCVAAGRGLLQACSGAGWTGMVLGNFCLEHSTCTRRPTILRCSRSVTGR